MKAQKLKFTLLLSLALSIVSCKKDEIENTSIKKDDGGSYTNVTLSTDHVPEKRTFDILDSKTITDGLTIDGASKYLGTPPAPSTDENAPSLYDFGSPEVVHATQGGKVKMDLKPENGEIAGIYMKVPGADEYFDIPVKASSFKKGNNQSIFSKIVGNNNFEFRSSDNEYFELELQENLSREFCFNYCVYDSAGLVSNVISQCVVIESIGGQLPFNHSSWKVLHFFESEEGVTTKTYLGEADEIFRDTIIGCYNDDTYEYDSTYFEIIESSYTLDYASITFNTDGTWSDNVRGSDKDVDDNWDCQDGPVQYITEKYDESETGYWNYDDQTKVLVLIYGEEGNQYVDEFILSVDGDNLMISYGDDEYIHATVLGKK